LRGESAGIYDIGMRTISLKLPEALLEELDRAAKEKQMTRSTLIRKSLERTLHQQRGPVSCYDLARDLAGSVKGMPADLAENPSYMDDFGK